MAFDSYQIKAIEDNSKSLIITAGAGSGKTTTMIGRVLRAINHRAITKQLSKEAVVENINPEQIQVVSFTNVAANTFKERLSILSNGAADDVNVSTLDKFAIKIIQHIYPKAKCDLDEASIARTLYDDLNHITHLQDRFNTFSQYFEKIEEAEQRFTKKEIKERKKLIYDEFIDDYIKYITEKYSPEDEFSIPLQVVYKFAVITMIEYNFAPDLKMLIVDELQDTSDAQFVLLNFLQSQLRELKFIGIGDVSQSMYRWNNAKPQRVSQYIDEYEAELLTLPNNYRSHPQIIDFANNLLKCNFDNIAGIQLNAKSKIDFEPSIKDDERVSYLGGIIAVYEQVATLVARGIKPEDIAIIGRSTSPLQKLEELFYDSKFKINAKQNNKNRRINYLSFVSRKLSVFMAQLEDNKEQINQIISFLKDRKLISENSSKLEYYSDLKQSDHQNYVTKLTSELTKHKTRLNEQLRNLLYQAPISENRPEGEITLSTVHSVKGDEFDYVIYIPPHKYETKLVEIDNNLDDEEKEALYGEYSELQNIDYVAATRAREQLFIVGYGQDFEEKKSKIEDCKRNKNPYNKDVEALLSHLK